MTTRLATLNPHQEYGVNDIGDVLSPSVNDAGNDEGFSFQDIESVLEQDLVLEPGSLLRIQPYTAHVLYCRPSRWF